MGLSDAEIALRLAALRRQREALDREIADLVLYQELGRRLGAVRAGADGPDPDSGPVPTPDRTAERDTTPAPRPAAAGPSDSALGAARASGPGAAPTGAPAPGPSRARATQEAVPPAVPPAIAFTDDVAGARRYGRAVVEAACTILARAGRPLHAAEILDGLAAQGFTLPGRDPVAALNTRLWKRSGPGGPLRRVGEATYALADLAADPGHP